MFGELNNPKNQKLLDLDAREIAIMVPLIVLIFVMGVYPNPFIEKMDPAIKKLVTQIRPASMNVQQSNTATPPAGHSGMPGQIPAAPAGMSQEGQPAAPAVNQHESK